MDDLGGKPPIFGNIHIVLKYQVLVRNIHLFCLYSPWNWPKSVEEGSTQNWNGGGTWKHPHIYIYDYINDINLVAYISTHDDLVLESDLVRPALSRLSRLRGSQCFRSSACHQLRLVVEIPKNQGFHTSQVVRISSIKGTGRFRIFWFWAMFFCPHFGGKGMYQKKMNHFW